MLSVLQQREKMNNKKTDIEFSIRAATLDDASAMADIYRRSWSAAYNGLLPAEAIQTVNAGRDAGCRKMLAGSSSGWHFLALKENTPIGLLSLCRCRDKGDSAYGEIRAIYLLPEYWHSGYGRRMLKFAVEELRSRGFDSVILWVLESNLRARRFYEANGFAFDGASKTERIGEPQTELRYLSI